MRGWIGLLALSGSLLSGCGDGEAGQSAQTGESIYVIPSALSELAQETFFDHPWPSDLRKEADGTVRFEGYPNPREKPILSVYIDSLKGLLTAFSPVASGFVRFSVPLDQASLPQTPPDALDPKSSVQLIDIDAASPEHGKRKLVSLYFQKDVGVYWPENTLSFMPALGYPLRKSTRYALVVTSAVRAVGGGRIGPSADLEAVLGLASADGAKLAAHDALTDAVSELGKVGISKNQIVHLAVFTTDDPTAPTAKIRDYVLKSYPAPKVLDWTPVANVKQVAGADVYEGHYGPSPNFQQGTPPFTNYGDGGGFVFDAQGVPVVQGDPYASLRFALSVPKAADCPMPPNGYPIVVYAHGTGGNYRSFLGSDSEGPALAKAGRCIATMGIDQIFHGTRAGAPPPTPVAEYQNKVALAFFNINNPVAARTNGPQSAIDVVQQARLFKETKISIPANVALGGSEIKFDPDNVLFMGHSQGGLNGPLFLGVDDQAKAGMLSGSASMISITFLEKHLPIDVAGLAKSLLFGLSPSEYSELNLFHPAMTLAQSIVDQSDPIHYVPMIAVEPRPGFAPKSLMQTEGVNADGSGDSYAPPHGIEVEAVAAGLPPQNPIIHPIEELPWGALQPVTVPSGGLSGNIAGGKASGVLAQWEAAKASDGHFVIYDIPAAMTQATGFLRYAVDEPKGRVPAP